MTTRPEPLALAVAQPLNTPGDLAANVAAHIRVIEQARAALVVFPELSLTGYDLSAPVIDPADPALAPIRSACASSGSIALVGAPIHELGADYIATLLVTGTDTAVVYRKMYLGDDEVGRFSPGTEPAAIEIGGRLIGLGICKDTRMPAHLDRTLARGIDLYVAGLAHHDHEADELESRARHIAELAQIPVAFASAAGAHPPCFPRAAGHSAIWGPDGIRLAQLGEAPTSTPAKYSTDLACDARGVNTPQPEPLDTPDDYGLTELGTGHWSLDDVYRRITKARSWWVTTVRPDGRPHAVPLWGVALDQRIIFSTGPDTVKAENLAANPNLVVHLESGDEVVIVEGTGLAVTYDHLPAGYPEAYNTKYELELDFTDPGFAFVEVAPTKIMAWDEADFAATAARWRFGQS